MSGAALTSVALPNGHRPGGTVARLSLFLSPRLEPDAPGGRLDGFGPFVNWPALLAADRVRYLVEVDGHGEVPVRVVSPPPRADLWRALFHTGMPVERREPVDPALRTFVTYPMARIAGYLRDRYQGLGADHPTDRPPRAVMADRFGEVIDVIRRGAADRAEVDRRLAARLGAARGRMADRARLRRPGEPARPALVGEEDGPGPAADFAMFEQFHHQPPGAEVVEAAGTAPSPVDFHAALSALADHPALLRQLGLVVDLEIDVVQLPVPGPSMSEQRIRARPVWSTGAPALTVETPWTRYVGPQVVFRPESRSTDGGFGDEMTLGLLALGNGNWDLIQFDVDGAAFGAIGAAVGHAHDPGSRDDRDAPGGLRTAGFTIARAGAAEHLSAAMDVQHAATGDRTFLADDLVRGYRVDVFEARTGKWRSLQARNVTYTIPGGPAVPPVSDEGFVRRSVREPVGTRGAAPAGSPLFVHEALARWNGWSLAATHPGKALRRDPRPPDAAHPETLPQKVPNEPLPGGIPLRIEVTATPGTLPRLRTGQKYQFRVRTVDLAGNGLSPDEATSLLDDTFGALLGARYLLPADGPEPYRRHEPIGSPELVARAAVAEGESIAHLVIRSDAGSTAAAWAAAHHTGAACERHVVPPKVSQLMAERLGRFDAAIGTGNAAAAKTAYAVARKEKGKLTDAVVLLSTGTTVTGQVTPITSPAGNYVVNPHDQLVVPYLPDPLALGVTVAGAPGVGPGTVLQVTATGTATSPAPTRLEPDAVPESLVTVPFGAAGKWPEVLGFRLRLAEGPLATSWDHTARVLTVQLPQAARVRLELSCFPGPDRLSDLAVRGWTAERLGPAAPAYDALAALGRTWQTSPARVVELVHAVQRPVRAPVVQRLVAGRGPGAGHAVLTGMIGVHGASSERVELVAEWTDRVDRVEQDSPVDVPGTAPVLGVPIHLRRDGGPAAPSTAPGTFYDEDRDVVVLTGAGVAGVGAALGGAAVDAQPRHEFGDTRHRVVRYHAVATSRFREYFPAAVAANAGGVSRAGATVEVDVPSSARPATPKVRYVVPTFGWDRSAVPGAPARTVTRRKGNGLRIYLDRPWYSSGAGELLAVVVQPSASFPPAEVAQMLTRWGRDPLWQSDPVRGAPLTSNLPRAVRTASALTLPEAPGATVAVAGHEVTYDKARKLWCCDLELTGAAGYTPFVRLALARWQPSSVPGLELSPVVIAQFAQLAPDRTLTAVRSRAGSKLRLDLTLGPDTGNYVAGPPGLVSNHLSEGPTGVDLTVERRLARTTGDAGWVDATGESGVSATSAPHDDPSVAWTGHAEVPATGGPYRVVVREVERFEFLEAHRPVFTETVLF